MNTAIYKFVGVLPMVKDGPCFATPLFSTPTSSNRTWYQIINEEAKIDAFGEVDDSLFERIRCPKSKLLYYRAVGWPAIFSFLRPDGLMHVDEPKCLVPALRKEFDLYIGRPHLRHSIAKFMGDKGLIKRSAAEIRPKRDIPLPSEFMGRPVISEARWTSGFFYLEIRARLVSRPRIHYAFSASLENRSTLPVTAKLNVWAPQEKNAEFPAEFLGLWNWSSITSMDGGRLERSLQWVVSDVGQVGHAISPSLLTLSVAIESQFDPSVPWSVEDTPISLHIPVFI